MQPWALASTAELAARVGAIPADDTPRAESAIEDASALVLHEAGDPDWTAESVPPAVRTVVLAMAQRKFTNPDDLIGDTSTRGPFVRGEQRDRGSVGVYLTDTETKIVRRYRSGGGNGLWKQRLTRGDDVDTTLWLNGFGVDPFPAGTSGELGQ